MCIRDSPDLALKRTRVVLDRMVEARVLTREQAEQLEAEAATLEIFAH